MPGYVYNDKVAWRIFSDLKLPPYNGVVPSTVPKQVAIAIEKILFCYDGMVSPDECGLLVDSHPDKKGEREKLVRKIDQKVALAFEALYVKHTSNYKRTSMPSMKNWIASGVRLRVYVRECGRGRVRLVGDILIFCLCGVVLSNQATPQ
jgi:hypothetical protein